MEIKNVLYVDNEPLCYEGIKVLLLEKLPNVTLHFVQEVSHLFDKIQNDENSLVFLDYQNVEGLDLSAIVRLKLLFPNLNIVVITRDLNKARLQSILEIGVLGILSKKMRIAEYKKALETLIKKEPFISAAIHAALLKSEESKNDQPKLLTSRELEILSLIALGKTNKAIGKGLGISYHTVHTHRKNIMKKLSASSSQELVLYAVNNGVLQLPYTG